MCLIDNWHLPIPLNATADVSYNVLIINIREAMSETEILYILMFGDYICLLMQSHVNTLKTIVIRLRGLPHCPLADMAVISNV